jgi:hypothetical protein
VKKKKENGLIRGTIPSFMWWEALKKKYVNHNFSGHILNPRPRE